MYTKPRRIYNDLRGMENYIDGVDVYNSLLLYILGDPKIEREEFEVKTSYRPDLIADSFYGSVNYEPYVILQLKIPIEKLERGTKIKLISKANIDNILQSIK